MVTTKAKVNPKDNGDGGLTREREAIERAVAASEGLSLPKRAKAVQAVLAPLLEQELEIELMMHANAKTEDDALPTGGFPGYDLSEDGEAKAWVQVRPDRIDREFKACTSYGQRLRRLRDGLADLEANVDPIVLDMAKKKVAAEQPKEEG